MRALVLALLVFVACDVHVGPFYPPHPKPCAWEGDCPTGYTCKFPEIDHRAVCMPGSNELDERVH